MLLTLALKMYPPLRSLSLVIITDPGIHSTEEDLRSIPFGNQYHVGSVKSKGKEYSGE